MRYAEPRSFLSSLPSALSRRGQLSLLIGGMVTAGPLTSQIEESAAGKRGKRKRNKQRRKNENSKTRPAATCLGPGEGVGTLSDSPGIRRWAQTFTALASGSLVRADLLIVKHPESAGDYILHLAPVDNFGVPTNDVPGETVVANADVPVGFLTVPFTFADPFSVTAGTVYALVLTRPGGQLQWDGNANNPCSGQAFASPNQAAPFAEVDVPDFDFIITTFTRS